MCQPGQARCAAHRLFLHRAVLQLRPPLAVQGTHPHRPQRHAVEDATMHSWAAPRSAERALRGAVRARARRPIAPTRLHSWAASAGHKAAPRHIQAPMCAQPHAGRHPWLFIIRGGDHGSAKDAGCPDGGRAGAGSARGLASMPWLRLYSHHLSSIRGPSSRARSAPQRSACGHSWATWAPPPWTT